LIKIGKTRFWDTSKYLKNSSKDNYYENEDMEESIYDQDEVLEKYSLEQSLKACEIDILESTEELQVLQDFCNDNSMRNLEDIPTDDFEDTVPNVLDIQDIEQKNNGKSGNKKSKVKKAVAYDIFKTLLERHVFKCCNGQMLVYSEAEGRYMHLSENQLKILIRSGWNEEIQEKLSRNVMIEVTERLFTEPSIQVQEDYFNRNIHLMNFLNGVLDLETDEFMEHSPEYGFTHCIQADYKFNPKYGQTYKKFISTAMEDNNDKERHLQEVVGYILSEFYTAKKVPMIIGKPHSGKSTLNRIISSLLGGEQVANVPLHRLHERFILAHLSTKKVNICSEISDEALSNIEIFKAITGNDELVAEYKGKDHFTYKSKIKLLFSGNCMPALKNQDITTAFFDRLTFINFNYTVPEEDRDHDLERKLLEEDREYIIYWAVKGIKRLMNNNFVFSESDESVRYKEKYIAEQNHIDDFIMGNCLLGKQYRIHSRDIYSGYLSYCYLNCITPLSKDKFFSEISKQEIIKKKFRLSDKNPLWGYIGITLRKI
jgi:putative DNA primase/helicase